MERKRKQPERQSFSRVCSCTFRLFRHFRREKAGHRKAGSTRPAVLVVLLAAALFVCLFIPAGLTAHAFRTGSGQPVAAIEENAGGEQGGASGDLSIEVVGQHSIDEEIIIEDSEVPLAMYSSASSGDGLRHAVMMGAVLLCVIGYTLYFDRREKKLFDLHREAALEQKRLMDENIL